MKKIIIISHTMRIGGAERALIGLLNAIDYSKYEVDLFLFLHDGEMLSLIPKEVNLLPQNKKYAGMLQSVKENLKQGNLDILYGKYKAKKKAKNFIQHNHIGNQNLVYDNYLQKELLNYLPQISTKNYDLSVSFLTPHYVGTEKVTTKKSIAWIHTDYSFFEFDKRIEQEMWSAYDFIASISEAVEQGFTKQFPELSSKLIEIENILHPDFIFQQANAFAVEEEMPIREKEVSLLSVGRFSHAKNFDNVPLIVKLLVEKGIRLKWYLIGYGGEEVLIREKILEHGLQDHVIILGKKENPYPYMQACDVYVQPSRFEGKAVTVREAQILGKPVVITNFATAKSQLTHGLDGWIIPLETEASAIALADFLQNTEMQHSLSENCKNTDFGNKKEVEKVYNLMMS